jgi:hypothetical protein
MKTEKALIEVLVETRAELKLIAAEQKRPMYEMLAEIVYAYRKLQRRKK